MTYLTRNQNQSQCIDYKQQNERGKYTRKSSREDRMKMNGCNLFTTLCSQSLYPLTFLIPKQSTDFFFFFFFFYLGYDGMMWEPFDKQTVSTWTFLSKQWLLREALPAENEISATPRKSPAILHTCCLFLFIFIFSKPEVAPTIPTVVTIMKASCYCPYSARRMHLRWKTLY